MISRKLMFGLSALILTFSTLAGAQEMKKRRLIPSSDRENRIPTENILPDKPICSVSVPMTKPGIRHWPMSRLNPAPAPTGISTAADRFCWSWTARDGIRNAETGPDSA